MNIHLNCLMTRRIFLILGSVFSAFSVFSLFIVVAVLLQAAPTNAHAGMNHETIAAITEHTASYRATAQNQLATVRARPDARSESVVLELCSQKRQQLETVINEASLLSLKKVATMDAIYLGVQNYYKERALNVPGYEQALAKTSTAQESALIDSSVLGVLNRPIQCVAATDLIDVLAFRSGTAVAVESLKAYEQALLEFISLVQSTDIGYDAHIVPNNGGV